jgi:CRP/FNR family cyclic AMP-dependent transcriptional regulator
MIFAGEVRKGGFMPKYPQDKVIARLFMKGQPLNFAKGDMILGNSHDPDGVYFISTGYTKVYSIGLDGEEYIHLLMSSGEIFPLTWAYTGILPSGVYIEAISNVLVWRIARDWFLHFVSARSDIAFAMGIQLAHQSWIYTERIDNLLHKKASQRVAYRLLYLVKRFGIKTEDGFIIDPTVTHENIANSVNLARESVSRELFRLEQGQIIKRVQHRTVIIDIPKLIEIIGQPIDVHAWYLD